MLARGRVCHPLWPLALLDAVMPSADIHDRYMESHVHENHSILMARLYATMSSFLTKENKPCSAAIILGHVKARRCTEQLAK